MLPTEKGQDKRRKRRRIFPALQLRKKLVVWRRQARNRIPTCLDWSWSQGRMAERGHPKPPWNTDKAVPAWSWKEKLFPGPAGNRAGRSEWQGLRFCQQAWQGSRRQSVTSARMEITSCAWGLSLSCHLIVCLPAQKDAPPFLYNFTLLPSFSFSPFLLNFCSPLPSLCALLWLFPMAYSAFSSCS